MAVILGVDCIPKAKIDSGVQLEDVTRICKSLDVDKENARASALHGLLIT